jgi:hypothetical protein
MFLLVGAQRIFLLNFPTLQEELKAAGFAGALSLTDFY